MAGSMSRAEFEVRLLVEEIREKGVEVTPDMPIFELLHAAKEIAKVLQWLCDIPSMRVLDEDTREKLLDMVWEQALPYVDRKAIQPATAEAI